MLGVYEFQFIRGAVQRHWQEHIPLLEIAVEPPHSRDQQLLQFIGTKQSFYIRKRFNVHMISLGHQHGLRFIVLVLQYGGCGVM